MIIIFLRIRRWFLARKYHDEVWSWNNYRYSLYKVYHKRLDRLADKATKKLIRMYEFLSHGGYPENPNAIEREFMDAVNQDCNASVW